MSPGQYIDEIITRYLSGTITPEEKRELFLWILQSPGNEQKFRDMELIWDLSRLSGVKHKPEMIFSTNRLKSLKKTLSPTKRPIIYPLTGIAAAIVLLISISYPFLFPGVNNEDKMLAISTPHQTKGDITLCDETHIWLNQNSTLSYPERFSGKTREVSIKTR